MPTFLKAIVIGILLVCSSFVYGAITLPSVFAETPSRWFIEAAWLYLEPFDETLTNIPYSLFHVGSLEGGPQFEQINRIDSSSDSGIRLSAGYHFPGSADLAGLSYTYFQNTNSNNTQSPLVADQVFLTAFLSRVLADLGFESSISAAQVRQKTTYQTVDLWLSHDFCLNYGIIFQVLGGLDLFSLNEELKANYSGTNTNLETPADIVDNVKFENHFLGVGPQIGIQSLVPIIGGFGVVASIGGGVLIGDSDSDYSDHFSNPGSTGINFFPFQDKVNNAFRFVPDLVGKVGVQYSHAFNNQTAIVLTAGYQGEKYFSAADDSTLIENIVDPADLGVGVSLANKNRYADFAIGGPFVSLVVHFG